MRVDRVRAALALTWAMATLLGLTVAITTRIGPVLFSFSATHGVHVGDVIAFAAAYAGAAAVTRRVRNRRSRRTSRPEPTRTAQRLR